MPQIAKPQTTRPQMASPAPQRGRPQKMTARKLACSECGGRLARRSQFRLSKAFVIIGFIILIPSVMGLLIGVILFATSGSAKAELKQALSQDSRSELQEAGVPPGLIEKLSEGQKLTSDEMKELTGEQQALVLGQAIGAGMSELGAGMAEVGGAFIRFIATVMMIGSSVGCVGGVLLTLRKKMLCCVQCGAMAGAR